MGNNDNKNNNDLDDELVRSIEKLVEEETNVAKAFVDNSSNSESSENDHRIYRNNSTGNNVVRTYSEDGVDLGATRMIDSDTINKAKTAQKKIAKKTAGMTKMTTKMRKKMMKKSAYPTTKKSWLKTLLVTLLQVSMLLKQYKNFTLLYLLRELDN